jgi:hypothetical protein
MQSLYSFGCFWNSLWRTTSLADQSPLFTITTNRQRSSVSFYYMLEGNEIDKKYHEGLKKFENSEPMLSSNTMYKYVHHKSFSLRTII